MSEAGGSRVLGCGVVSPSGWGMPEGAVRGGVAEEALLSRPRLRRPAARVAESGPLWDRWKREPRMRRAAPIARFMAEAVRQALEGAEPGLRRGLIGCFSLGGIVFSRKFYEGMQQHGRGLASPALFPETVYNSPLSHVAAVHGLDGPADSLVGDESCWAAALGTAEMWLVSGEVEEVVVVAGDEVDAIALEGYEAAGWFRRRAGWVAAEGAAALRLGRGGGGPAVRLAHPPLPCGKGFPPARERAEAMARGLPEGGRVLRTGKGTDWEALEADWLGGNPSLAWDPACVPGHSLSISPAWASCAARAFCATSGGPLIQPVWGSSHACAALVWEV